MSSHTQLSEEQAGVRPEMEETLMELDTKGTIIPRADAFNDNDRFKGKSSPEPNVKSHPVDIKNDELSLTAKSGSGPMVKSDKEKISHLREQVRELQMILKGERMSKKRLEEKLSQSTSGGLGLNLDIIMNLACQLTEIPLKGRNVELVCGIASELMDQVDRASGNTSESGSNSKSKNEAGIANDQGLWNLQGVVEVLCGRVEKLEEEIKCLKALCEYQGRSNMID